MREVSWGCSVTGGECDGTLRHIPQASGLIQWERGSVGLKPSAAARPRPQLFVGVMAQRQSGDTRSAFVCTP